MMRTVNLLPWRAWRRERRARFFKQLLLGCVPLAGLILLAADRYLLSQVSAQHRLHSALSSEIVVLDRQLEQITRIQAQHAALRDLLAAQAALQGPRQLSAQVLEQLRQVVPEGVQLSEVKVGASEVVVGGVSASVGDVTRLLQGLSRTPGVQGAALQERKATEAGEQFRLLAHVAPPVGEVQP